MITVPCCFFIFDPLIQSGCFLWVLLDFRLSRIYLKLLNVKSVNLFVDLALHLLPVLLVSSFNTLELAFPFFFL